MVQNDGNRATPGSHGNRTDAAQQGVRTTTEWDEVTRRYRRPPGGWWWLALLAVPALLAAIGLGVGAGDSTAADATGSPTMSAPASGSSSETSVSTSVSTSASSSTTEQTTTSGAPGAGGLDGVAPFSIARAGGVVTVTAQVPDEAARASLLDEVKKSAGSGVTIKDAVTVKSGIPAPPASAVAPVLSAATKTGDYDVAWTGQAMTLKGTAGSDADKAAVESAAKGAFPAATIDNQITVGTASAGDCATLAKYVTDTLAKNKLVFENNGVQLTDASTTVAKGIGTRAKACANAKLTVTGHTDNSGTDAINNPLSMRRAQAVRQVLIQAGVPAGNVTAVGKGSKEPITSNATEAGRSQNRRVQIAVS